MSRNVVLVCGGRNFRDLDSVFRTLDALHAEKRITCIVQGGAAGADYLASLWSETNAVACAEFGAEWEKYGKSAGPTRNLKMLRETHPNLVVAFPGGKGTAHMIGIARAKGVEVREIPVTATPLSESPLSETTPAVEKIGEAR